MQKNTVWFIILSVSVLLMWQTWFMPKKPPVAPPSATQEAAALPTQAQSGAALTTTAATVATAAEPEQETVIETDAYKAVFTSRGAGVKHWYLKEKDGSLMDLVLPDASPCLATFPGSTYRVARQAPDQLVFTHDSPLGWRVTKTFTLSDEYLHTISITTTRLKPDAVLPVVELTWGPGLGTEAKEQKDNYAVTRAIGYANAPPRKLEKFKAGEFYSASTLRWAAVDNRFFLAAFVMDNTSPFSTVSAFRQHKKQPYGIVLSSPKPGAEATQTYAVRMYLGPKGHTHLRSLNLDLEKSVDFGFFGFLGKITLSVLLFFYGITHNFGWAIILLTILIQIIVLPLTLKSFKASAHMKKLQPLFKEVQAKYKDDPRRLQQEMMALYRVHKFNPMSGCLPMVLQLPIFWALFTTLRNAFELRGAPWILWVKDLSAPETLFALGSFNIHILPLVMGIGMFFQQKMMTQTSDPTQAKIMYLMPGLFIFMFWSFPSGLVLYWLTNSIVTMIEQTIVMRESKGEPVHGRN